MKLSPRTTPLYTRQNKKKKKKKTRTCAREKRIMQRGAGEKWVDARFVTSSTPPRALAIPSLVPREKRIENNASVRETADFTRRRALAVASRSRPAGTRRLLSYFFQERFTLYPPPPPTSLKIKIKRKENAHVCVYVPLNNGPNSTKRRAACASH